MHRALLALGSALLFAPHGCSSQGGQDRPRSVSTGGAALGSDAGSANSAPSTSPGAAVCPADHPVACASQCCPAGSACADGGTPSIDAGSCIEAAALPACPASLPTACAAPPSAQPDGGVLAFDLSAQHNHATLRAPATFGEGRGTSALLFPSALAAQCNVSAPGGGFPSGDAAHTLEAWVWVGGASGTLPIASAGSNTGNAITALEVTVGSDARGATFAASFNGCAESGAPHGAGSWHLLAGTYAGNGGLTTVYVDGAAVAQCPGLTRNLPAATQLHFGALPQQPCALEGGRIDELRLRAGLLGASDAAADFHAPHLPLTADTVGLWNFDEGAGVRCCPPGSACDGSGRCTDASGAAPACPASAPVICGDGTCCPANTSCADGACVGAAVAPAIGCGAGQIVVPATFEGGGDFTCCPAPPAGSSPLTSGLTFCLSGNSTPTCELPASANCAGGCPAGYGCCQVGASTWACAAAATGGDLCATGGPLCEGDAAGPGGCCPSGTSCGGSGACCPAGESACGPGCCASGQCVNGSCGAAPAPTSVCPDGGIACGSVCCAPGDACADGQVCLAAPQAAVCSAGETACSSIGPCCPSGFDCSSGACVATGPAIPRGGPQGAPCGDGYCEPAQVCSSGVCCAADHPDACGDTCCLAGACGGTTCSCPASQPIACGSECCADGSACVDGRCSASCTAGATLCGSSCCAPGIACVDGDCACPGDHPVVCGDGCCLAGATCSDGACGCPAGEAACGDEGCAAGESCQAGACVQASTQSCSSSGQPQAMQTCPNGSQMCCYVPEVCCVSPFDGSVGCFPAAYCQ